MAKYIFVVEPPFEGTLPSNLRAEQRIGSYKKAINSLHKEGDAVRVIRYDKKDEYMGAREARIVNGKLVETDDWHMEY